MKINMVSAEIRTSQIEFKGNFRRAKRRSFGLIS